MTQRRNSTEQDAPVVIGLFIEVLCPKSALLFLVVAKVASKFSLIVVILLHSFSSALKTIIVENEMQLVDNVIHWR